MPLFLPKLLNVVTKTADYTANGGNDVILCNTNALTITLPSASVPGKVLQIKTIDSGAHTMTISRAGSDTIEGATSVTMSVQYSGYELVSDGGTMWHVINKGIWV